MSLEPEQPNANRLNVAAVRRVRLDVVVLSISLLALFLLTGCDSSPDVTEKPKPKVTKSAPVEPVADTAAVDPTPVHLVESNYVADRQCAECHEEIWDSYQNVGMAQSAYEFEARPPIEDFDNAHFYHEPSQKHYEMAVEDGKFTMTRYREGKDGQRINVHKQVADFVIGSGNHSKTYTWRDSTGAMFQMPVVWYSQTKEWGMAPGFDRKDHDDFTRPISRECMFCHNAYPDFESGTDNFLSQPVYPNKLPHGIGCQRCHGPGEAHVKAAEKDPQAPDVLTTIINSSKLPKQQRDDVCNQCHLQPTSARKSMLRDFDRDAWSFRPGEKLSDFQAYTELASAESSDLFEVNHHSYRMHQSKCFTESDGALNCVTCHDPHSTVTPEKRVSHYRSTCFKCHGAEDCLDVERGHQPNANCVECHMPLRRAEDAIHVTMTDHKIARPTDKDLLAKREEVTVSPTQTVKVFSWNEDAENRSEDLKRQVMRLIDKDFGVVGQVSNAVSRESSDGLKATVAQAMLETGRSDEALRLLNDISPAGKKFSVVQSNLGLGLIQQQKFALAVKFLEKAIQLEPVVPEAHFNLAICYVNLGKDKEAIEQFKNATRLQPNLAKAGFYLGASLARNERFDEAEKELKRVLQIDPDYQGAGLMLAGIMRRQDKLVEAISMLEDEKIYRPKDVGIANELSLLSIEAVADKKAQPRVSLDHAKHLFKLNRKDANVRMILAMALLQNGYDEKTLEAIGSLAKKKTASEKLIMAAIAKKNLGQEDASKLYKRATESIYEMSTPKSRVLEVAIELAKTKFDQTENN